MSTKNHTPPSIQLETELKIKITPEDMLEIERRIKKKKFVFKKEVMLDDTYFDTDPPSLPKNRVLKLRIERKPNTISQTQELTIKEQLTKPSLAILEKNKNPKSSEGIQTRKEIGFKVDSKKAIHNFLQALNYKPFIKVKKTRKYFHNANTNLTICLDKGPLGTYMEIEQMNKNAKESSKTIKMLLDVLLQGLKHEIETRSYLEIAKDQRTSAQSKKTLI